jgi:hypothetical protein
LGRLRRQDHLELRGVKTINYYAYVLVKFGPAYGLKGIRCLYYTAIYQIYLAETQRFFLQSLGIATQITQQRLRSN